MPSQNEIRTTITQTIIDALASGTLPPWRKPWANDPNAPGLHTSLSTGAAYRGINQIILQAASMRRDQTFKSKWWGTFHQIKQLGASVRKGQKGTHIVLFKRINRTRTDDDGVEVDESFPVMRTFTAFNAEQTSGLDQFRVGFAQPQHDSQRYEHADAVIDATRADIRHGGNRAFYSVDHDFIQVPFRHQFDQPEAYYETALHELCHWSEKRVGLDRNQPEKSYAFFELVAEIGSCFLMGELGLPTTDNLDNHAAYLKSWLKGMEDPKFIFRASAQASKAADFILSFSRTQEPIEEPSFDTRLSIVLSGQPGQDADDDHEPTSGFDATHAVWFVGLDWPATSETAASAKPRRSASVIHGAPARFLQFNLLFWRQFIGRTSRASRLAEEAIGETGAFAFVELRHSTEGRSVASDMDVGQCHRQLVLPHKLAAAV